ncbi:MAG: polysaccharide deacetylase family protein [Thermoleophilia bacterium]|jgi:peptidoglycan/xylan/chitin deacetylase (PgdA/CDA1 family)
MTKKQALRALGSLAGGVALFTAGTAHVLWHRGNRKTGATLLICGIATDFLLLVSFLVPNFPLTGRVFHRGRPGGNLIALTFDDGPRPPFTEAILDTLKRESIPATFFVLGENARRWPEAVRRMEHEGHRVANHGFDHGILMFAGAAEALGQVDKTEAILLDAGVTEPCRLFRAPHGWLSPVAHRALTSHGYRIAGWTKGVWDTANPGVETIVSRTDDVLRPGSVLLFHDGWSGAGEEDRSQTVAALSEIIRLARERGLKFVTLEEMMEEEGWI